MAERVAVVGVGQTKHDACRADVSIAGLVWIYSKPNHPVLQPTRSAET